MTRTLTPPIRPDTSSRTYSFRKHAWRYKVVLETTFGISILEPWEKLLFCTFTQCPHSHRPYTEHAVIVLSLFASLFTINCVRHLPLQFVRMQRRLAYYLWGNEEGMYTA